MIYVHWIVFVLYTILAVLAMLAVLMDNRQPAKTIAWLLVLSFVPVLGIILYIFFGQNLRRNRKMSQQKTDILTKRTMLGYVEQHDLIIPEKYRFIINQFSNQTYALPFKDNETDIYTDGHSFFLALLKEIGRAKKHIHIDTYIIDDDPLGRLITDALIDKAREGVEVRMIYDDVGSWKTKNRFFDRMRAAGIKVYPFMPVRFPAFTSKVNYRNHRKICIFDGTTGFIGGMNIAMRYVYGRNSQAWRDTHLRIRGNAVYGLQWAFLVDWYFLSREQITDRKYYPKQQTKHNGCLMQIVLGGPMTEWPVLEQGYVRILLEAKQYVYIETPYFLPTEPVLFAMRTAAQADIDVRLIMPKKGDAIFVEWASRTYLRDVAEAGVRVYLYEAGFNHSKLLVCDDSLASCGSANVDFRSFENNFEANAFIYDKPLAMRLKKVFMDDLKQSTLLDEDTEIHRQPFVSRLWESLVRLLSPLL